MPKVPSTEGVLISEVSPFDYVLTGSGNISRSGLSRGFEAGLVVGTDRSSNSNRGASRGVDRRPAKVVQILAGRARQPGWGANGINIVR